MGRINETVRTVNSAVRTLLFGVLLVGAGVGGWKAYSLYNEPQKKLDAKQQELEAVQATLTKTASDLEERNKQVASLSAEIEQKNAAIAKLETANHFHKLSHRLARLRVIDQRDDAETKRPKTEVEFFEVNEEGAPISDRRQKFTIDGDRIYVECLLAKFDDKYVEANDLEKGTAICLFQRIFGEHQKPEEGFAIDQVGSAPNSYNRNGQMSELEQRIWKDFWTLADDPAQAAKLGIRAAHADAPSLRVKKGGVYELELRTTGDFTFRRISEPSDETKQEKS
jgi:hypothetical protein